LNLCQDFLEIWSLPNLMNHPALTRIDAIYLIIIIALAEQISALGMSLETTFQVTPKSKKHAKISVVCPNKDLLRAVSLLHNILAPGHIGLEDEASFGNCV
jgi:hypothetical protein